MAVDVLIQDPEKLPTELQAALAHTSHSDFLDALAVAASKPHLTGLVFSQFEPLFVDVAGRLLLSAQQTPKRTAAVIAALARLLPCAPHLAVYLDRLLHPEHLRRLALQGTSDAWLYITPDGNLALEDVDSLQLQEALLAAIRLLNFDNQAYAHIITPVKIQSLLLHEQPAVRCLAIRLLTLYLHASDHFLQSLTTKHIGSQEVTGLCEGETIDLALLT